MQTTAPEGKREACGRAGSNERGGRRHHAWWTDGKELLAPEEGAVVELPM
jgi:hypothetical protein